MKFTRIIHEGQMEIFPHITISIGYVDEFGNDCDVSDAERLLN